MHKGQKFTHATNGKTVVVLKVRPFGRIDMGQMMEGAIPAGMSGIIRQWETSTHSIKALIEAGTYQPA